MLGYFRISQKSTYFIKVVGGIAVGALEAPYPAVVLCRVLAAAVEARQIATAEESRHVDATSAVMLRGS